VNGRTVAVTQAAGRWGVTIPPNADGTEITLH
jgi:hypothetical protein